MSAKITLAAACSILGAHDRSRDTHGDRNGETPKADLSVENGGDRAACREPRNASEHPPKACANARASLAVHPRKQIDGIECRLCRVARHDGRRRQVPKVQPLSGILRGHGRDPGKSGHQCGYCISVREWTERHGEDEEHEKKEHLGGEQNSQCWQSMRGQDRTRQSNDCDHANEFGERYELGDNALGAEDERRTQGDEIPCDVRRKQPLQAYETRGIDEAAVEAQQFHKPVSFHLLILPLS